MRELIENWSIHVPYSSILCGIYLIVKEGNAYILNGITFIRGFLLLWIY